MADELDFHGGKLSWHTHPGKANSAGTRRVLTIISAFGLAVAILALVVEHRFWWLSLTGRSATAKISARDERIIGWIANRRMAMAGQTFPLVETEFQYTFIDHTGAERQGTFTLPEASHAFRVGENLSVMYPRVSSGPAQPSEWGYYFHHNTVWLSFTSVGLLFLVIAVGCLVWRRRLAPADPQGK
jgi:hypothetical protein